MALKVAALTLLACIAVVWLLPHAFVPILSTGPDVPRAASFRQLSQGPAASSADEGRTTNTAVVAAAVAMGLLAGIFAAAPVNATETGRVEVNELWHSHDLKSHWIDFQARMDLGEAKDAKADPHFEQIEADVRLRKMGRLNYNQLKVERVARAMQEKDIGEPAYVDAHQPKNFYVPETVGKLVIPDFGAPLPGADVDY